MSPRVVLINFSAKAHHLRHITKRPVIAHVSCLSLLLLKTAKVPLTRRVCQSGVMLVISAADGD